MPPIRKAFKNFSDAVNRPIITRAALSRSFVVPSQKQYTDITLLKQCIDITQEALNVIERKLKDAGDLKEMRNRHKERYARHKQREAMDPKTHLLGQRITNLTRRQRTVSVLLSQLKLSYKELMKSDYETGKPSKSKTQRTKRTLSNG